MAALRLRLRARPPCLVDASPLVPELLAGKSAGDIERVQLQGWNEAFAVGELFRITGDDAAEVVLDSLDGSLIKVGAGMRGGTLTVIGDAGDYAGEGLRGGALHIRGRAGDYIGASMRGGSITVVGDAGSFAGSARAGHVIGMQGGTIAIRGNAGDRAGDRMRRGLLLIEGAAGAYCASRMLAGTIAVLGRSGPYPGYLMRRGTLLLNDASVEPLPTFKVNGTPDLLAVRMLLSAIAREHRAFRALARGRFTRWLGDLGAEGKGEMFVAYHR